MGDWEKLFQGVIGNYAQAYTTAKYAQPYEIEKLQLQAYGPGPGGVPYYQGQPVATGIPTGWLIVGGVALLAVVLIKS